LFVRVLWRRISFIFCGSRKRVILAEASLHRQTAPESSGENCMEAKCVFFAIRNGVSVEFAGVKFDSNRGISLLGSGGWTPEAGGWTRRRGGENRSFDSRWTDPPSSTDLPGSPCRRPGSPVCRGLGRPRFGRTTTLIGSSKCESVAISARRGGLFSMSCAIFCLRIRGDHAASPRPSNSCLSFSSFAFATGCE